MNIFFSTFFNLENIFNKKSKGKKLKGELNEKNEKKKGVGKIYKE